MLGFLKCKLASHTSPGTISKRDVCMEGQIFILRAAVNPALRYEGIRIFPMLFASMHCHDADEDPLTFRHLPACVDNRPKLAVALLVAMAGVRNM